MESVDRSARLRPLLALGWMWTVAFVFLFRYDAWLVPLQWAHVVSAAAPVLTIGPHFGQFVLSRLGDFFCVALILATAYPVGALVVGRFTTERSLLTGLLALGTGLWLVATGVLIIGAVAVPQVGWVFVGLAAWLVPAARRFGPIRLARPRLEPWEWTMIGCVVAALLLNLPGTMAPPFEYDELEYHLGAPMDYMRAGRIVFLPYNFYSNLPQLTEMLYLLALVVRSDIAAKLLHWGFGILAGLGAYALATRLWSRRVGLTALALFYCLPFVQDLSQTARIDLATAFYGVLTAAALLVIPGHCGVWLGALAAGMAVATKWTAIPVVFAPAALIVLLTRRSWRLTIGFCFLAAVPVLPWAVKNWVLAGNPVYPLFGGLFPSPHWTAAQAALFARKHYAALDAGGWWQLVERPWHYSLAEPMASPVLLLTAPLVLFLGRRSAPVRWAGWLLLAGIAGWFLGTFRPWRFVMPVLPLAAVLGAGGLGAVAFARGQRLVAQAAVGVVLLCGLATMTMVALVDAEDYKQSPPRLSFLQHSLGHATREEFLGRMGGGIYSPDLWMNANLPATAKVLYVGEARVYYAQHDTMWSTAFDQHPLTALMREHRDPRSLWQAWRARGISHVYVDGYEWQRLRRGYDYLREIDDPLLLQTLTQFANVVFARGPDTVYELHP